MWDEANKNEDFAAVAGWLATQKVSAEETLNDPEFYLKMQFVKDMAVAAGTPVVDFVKGQSKAGAAAFERSFQEWKREQEKMKK